MALSEEQIQRYSRQILLKDVGGIGQRRLLSSSVELAAQGPVFDTAARYLAAGGTPVRGIALTPFDPELNPSLPIAVRVARWPDVQGEAARVVLGAGADGSVRIAWRTADGCAECLERASTVDAPVDVPEATTLGALVALCAQRLILGTLQGVGAIDLKRDGELAQVALERCAEKR